MAPLITVEDLRTHMQRPIDQAAGELAVAGASGAVRSYCGWGIAAENAVFDVDGTGTTVLNLPTMHLTAVTSVIMDGAAVALGAASSSVYSAYYWTVRGQLYRTAGWPSFARITVACAHGFDPVPDVVRLVALTLASREVSNPERLRTAAVGSVSRTFDLAELDTRLLDPYRLP